MTQHRDSAPWPEYRELVLQCLKDNAEQLEALEEKIEELGDKLVLMNMELSRMQTTYKIVTGVIGFMGGLIPVLLHFFLTKVF